jgi:xanthine dehydrogenase iron-sulfur cluster and FAD-binding subunit A
LKWIAIQTDLVLSLKIKLRTTALKFILNEQDVSPHPSSAETLLDYVRQVRQLKGTKIGCREGDCGACTILVGELRMVSFNIAA